MAKLELLEFKPHFYLIAKVNHVKFIAKKTENRFKRQKFELGQMFDRSSVSSA